MSHRNLDGLPEKYFNVPENDEDIYTAQGILLDQIWVLNDMINTDTGGCVLELDEMKLNILSSVISSLTHQAKLLQDVSEHKAL